MGKSDRITTIQISSSTRDRLYRLKFRKTYDEYLNMLIDRAELSERRGRERPRADGKLEAMSRMTRDWMKRNVRKRKGGKLWEVDLDGR